MIMNCHGSHSAKVTLMDEPTACREAVVAGAEGLFKPKLIMGSLGVTNQQDFNGTERESPLSAWPSLCRGHASHNSHVPNNSIS
jgi:hypothetical protein